MSGWTLQGKNRLRVAERAGGMVRRRGRCTRGGLFVVLAAALLAGCSEQLPTEATAAGETALLSTAAATVTVSDVRAASGRSYRAVGQGASVGAQVYTDRPFAFSALPSAVRGMTYIRTANDDKAASAGSSSFLSFRVDRDVVVYVAHDDRLTRPSWLSTFSNSGLKVSVNESGTVRSFTLFRRSFAAGQVALGSNVPVYQGGSMYHVLVEPAAAEPAPSPSVPSPSGGYRKTTPHWSHIRTMITDYRIHYLSNSSQRAAEYDWTAAHFDWVLGNSPAYKSRNPAITAVTYAKYQAVMIPGRTGSSVQLPTGFYADMEAWYRDPAKNTGGWKLEDAFLHTSAPKSVSTRKTMFIWSSHWWVMNLGDPGYQAYTADRLRRIVNSTSPAYDGVMIDVHGNLSMYSRGTIEYPNSSDYWAADVRLIQFVRPRLGTNKFLMPNTAEYIEDQVVRSVTASGAAHLENFNTPFKAMKDRWSFVDRVVQAGSTAQMVNTLSRAQYNARSGFPAGNSASPAARGKLFELASYYMVVPNPADRVIFTSNNAEWSTKTFESQWSKAVEADVGVPLSWRSILATGTDPVGQSYEVWQRQFSRALIVVRPMAAWNQTRYDDATRVTVTLPAGEAWHPLHDDGRISSAVTSIRLRNGEAAIFIKGSAR